MSGNGMMAAGKLTVPILLLIAYGIQFCSADSYSLGSAETFFRITGGSASIYFIQQDLFKEGFILMSTDNILFTTDGKTMHTVVGSNNATGYREGTGDNALFNSIRCFVQRSSAEIIAADFYNYCLRTVDRNTNSTATFAGTCTAPGYVDGFKDQAKFWEPYGVVLDQNNLFIADHLNHAIRQLDLLSNQVTTFAKEDRALNSPHYLVKVNDNSFIVTTFKQGLVRVGPQSGNVRTLSKIGLGWRDGPLNEAAFNDARTVVLIRPDTALVSDTGNDHIRIVDLKSSMVSTLSANDQTVFTNVWSLLAGNGFLLVGQQIQGTPFVEKFAIRSYPDTLGESVKNDAPLPMGLVIGLSVATSILFIVAAAAIVVIVVQHRATSKLKIRGSVVFGMIPEEDGYDQICIKAEDTESPQNDQAAGKVISRSLPMLPESEDHVLKKAQNVSHDVQSKDRTDTVHVLSTEQMLKTNVSQIIYAPSALESDGIISPNNEGYEHFLAQVQPDYSKLQSGTQSPDSIAGDPFGNYVENPASEYACGI